MNNEMTNAINEEKTSWPSSPQPAHAIFNNSDEMVNHPPHYTDGGIEVIDFIKAKNLDFCLGNAVKYISRAGKKGDAALTEKEKTVEDLKKSIWYIKKEIEWLKGD